MDFKLLRLRHYLLNRLAEHEKYIGTPIGDGLLTLRMLVNSTPGVINIFVGSGRPSDAESTDIDVWYNTSQDLFLEKEGTNWNVFSVYREEFTTTIIDVNDDDFSSDNPTAIEIEGELSYAKTEKSKNTGEFTAWVRLASGRRYRLDAAEWEVESESAGVRIERDYKTNLGILHFDDLRVSTTVFIHAKFTLVNGETIESGRVPVVINVEYVAPNVSYRIEIDGPYSASPIESANYTATLITTIDEEETSADVTDKVEWEVLQPNYGLLTQDGILTVNPDLLEDSSGSILARMRVAGQTIVGNINVLFVARTVSFLEIIGPDFLKELTSVNFKAEATFTTGETVDVTDDGTWSIRLPEVGTMDEATGEFFAPDVLEDTEQTANFEFEHQSKPVRAEFDFIISNVEAPAITINGDALIIGGDSSQLTATVEFEDEVYDVVPEWSISPEDAGTIDENGLFTANDLADETVVTVTATLSYAGYHVTQSYEIVVKPRIIVPVSIEIIGQSEVMEGGTENYVAMATLSNGTVVEVTGEAVWLTSSTKHTISKGVLVAGQVNADTQVVLTANYTLNGETVTTDFNVKVTDDPEIWQPVSLAIAGLTEVNEGESIQLVANLTSESNQGNTKTEPVSVQWAVDKNGTVTDGLFTAALMLGEDGDATVSATYVHPNTIPLSAEHPVTILNVKTLLGLRIELDESSVLSGTATPFKVWVTKPDGETDVTSNANMLITSDNPNAVISKSQKRITTSPVEADEVATITASYSEVGEIVVANAELEIRASLIDTLTISALSNEVFENGGVKLRAQLTLNDGSLVDVDADWVITGGSEFATITDNILVVDGIPDDVDVTVHANYSSPETGDLTIESNTINIVFKKIKPVTMTLFNDTSVYIVEEGKSLSLKPRLVHNDSSVTYPVNVTYSTESEAVNLVPDPQTGILTIHTLDVSTDTVVTINAEYATPFVESGKIVASRQITIKYVRALVGLDLKLGSPPFFENETTTIALRELFDDGSLGASLTTDPDVVFTVEPLHAATVAGASLIFNEVDEDTPFTIKAERDGLESNLVGGTVKILSQQAITIVSSNGSDIKRGESTVLSASVTLSDGTIVNPSNKYPVVWGLSDETAGTLTHNPNWSATFKAGNLEANKNFNVTATMDETVGTKAMRVLGYAIPVSAVISGVSELESGEAADYGITITFSDGSSKSYAHEDANMVNVAWGLDFDENVEKILESGTIASGQVVAPKVSTNLLGYIIATYIDPVSGVSIDALAFPVTVKAEPLVIVPVSAVLSGKSSLESGEVAEYELEVTLSDDSKVFINSSSTDRAVWSKSITAGSLSHGKFTAPISTSPASLNIVAKFTLNGVNVEDTIAVTVARKYATTMTATPTSLNMYELETRAINLALDTGESVNGTWEANGLGQFTGNSFTGVETDEDLSGNLVATYSGTETNGANLTATVAATVKAIKPVSMILTNEGNSFRVNEDGEAELYAEVMLNNGSKIVKPESVVYEVISGDEFIEIENVDGVLTIRGKDVIGGDAQSVITGTYTGEDGDELVATSTITITDSVKVQTGITIEVLSAEPHYELSNVNLRVRNVFDDESYNTVGALGAVYKVTPASAGTVDVSGAAPVLKLASVSSDTEVTVAVTLNGYTEQVSVNAVNIVPVSVAVASSNGLTIQRGKTTALSARLVLNNGQTVDADTSFPVTWSNDNAAAGVFSGLGQTINFKAADLDEDAEVTVTATANNVTGVQGSLKLTVDGYPIPVTATLTGQAVVAAESQADYQLKIVYSDGSEKIASFTSSTVATWGTSGLTGATISKGRLTTGSNTSAVNGKVTASFTDAGVTLTADIDVTISALVTTTEPPVVEPTGDWESAIYVGQAHATGVTDTKITAQSQEVIDALTSALKTPHTDGDSGNLIYKVGDNVRTFDEIVMKLYRTLDSSHYGRFVVLYPASLGTSSVQNIAMTGSWDMPNTVVLKGTVTLEVGGVPTVFNLHRWDFPSHQAGAGVQLRARAI